MKEIRLTNGHTTIVDDEDYDDLSRFKWHALFQGGTKSFYAVRTVPKKEQQIAGHSERMHRRILGLKFRDGLLSDHINHDTLDNRRSNLRIVTSSENNRNRTTQSKYGIGVYRHGKRFRAAIRINGKFQHIGVYDSASEASGAVERFELHNRNSNVNI